MKHPHALTPHPRKTRGAALAVSLILLVVITIVGLASIRGTSMQEHMSANMLDRELAFQSAESALRVAENLNPMVHAVDCSTAGTLCDPGPAANAAGWVTVGNADYNPGAIATAQPQYFIERMGQAPDPESATGFNQSANSQQYGAQGTNQLATYFRITARNFDPAAAANAGRSLVTLQAMIKQ
jgi:type IV pilus assembly protein PilX